MGRIKLGGDWPPRGPYRMRDVPSQIGEKWADLVGCKVLTSSDDSYMNFYRDVKQDRMVWTSMISVRPIDGETQAKLGHFLDKGIAGKKPIFDPEDALTTEWLAPVTNRIVDIVSHRTRPKGDIFGEDGSKGLSARTRKEKINDGIRAVFLAFDPDPMNHPMKKQDKGIRVDPAARSRYNPNAKDTSGRPLDGEVFRLSNNANWDIPLDDADTTGPSSHGPHKPFHRSLKSEPGDLGRRTAGLNGYRGRPVSQLKPRKPRIKYSSDSSSSTYSDSGDSEPPDQLSQLYHCDLSQEEHALAEPAAMDTDNMSDGDPVFEDAATDTPLATSPLKHDAAESVAKPSTRKRPRDDEVCYEGPSKKVAKDDSDRYPQHTLHFESSTQMLEAYQPLRALPGPLAFLHHTMARSRNLLKGVRESRNGQLYLPM